MRQLAVLFLLVLGGCGTQEYQPPKDAIPNIPPGRTSGMDDLSPPKK